MLRTRARYTLGKPPPLGREDQMPAPCLLPKPRRSWAQLQFKACRGLERFHRLLEQPVLSPCQRELPAVIAFFHEWSLLTGHENSTALKIY